MRPKIGIFAGGIEWYWKETGMKELKNALEKDIRFLIDMLSSRSDVFYPGMAGNAEDAARIGRELSESKVDIALMHHATYIEDAMTLAFMDELCNIFPVVFLSQGVKGIPNDFTLIDYGRCWGNNSAAQVTGTLRRMKRERFGFVFGHIDNPRPINEIIEYGLAGMAVKRLKGSKIAYLPHRCCGATMYDTFPDDTMMMAQTGVRIFYCYTQEVVEAMEKIQNSEVDNLIKELLSKYKLIEPPMEELRIAVKQALALEKVVEKNELDAVAIDPFPEFVMRTGMLPALGTTILRDKGVVVSDEGDLTVAVGGLIIKAITSQPIHFWEHLMFDEEKNWLLGGHDSGSAAFSLAKDPSTVSLRNTMYINFENHPAGFYWGVADEFITKPGPVTLLDIYRGPLEYEMRISIGESVETETRPVHMAHTIWKPNCTLNSYFKRIAEMGIEHHFALVHAEVEGVLEKVAQILNMKVEYLTDKSRKN